jgi:hypothetical protein
MRRSPLDLELPPNDEIGIRKDRSFLREEGLAKEKRIGDERAESGCPHLAVLVGYIQQLL